MAFNGFLITVGDFTIPTDIINVESYNASRNVQDLDSYRDADGVLHREALEHTIEKVEFETVPNMTDTEVSELFSNIRNNYIEQKERRAIVTVYDPETDSYVTQDMYLANPTFPMKFILNGRLYYNSIRLSFTAY